jgi:TatD DNase family protein
LSFIDAHLHLADNGYAGKVEEVVEDAAQHNVHQMLSNATDYESSIETIRLAKRFPGHVLAAIGVHPSTATRSGAFNLEKFANTIDANHELISAIGEIGLDGTYTQDEAAKARQKEVFRFFLELGEQRRLPAVVHSRGAVPETLTTLAGFRIPHVLLHWYDGPKENFELLKERGYLISIGPAIMYSPKITEIARTADTSLILTETDGPVRYRGLFGGQLTKPSSVIEVVKKLAEVRGMSVDAIKSTISSNFERFLHG